MKCRLEPARREASAVWRFLAYVRPYRCELMLAVVTGVLKYNLPVIFPWLLKEVVDGLGKSDAAAVSRTDRLMFAALGLFAAYSIVVYYRTHFADRLAQKVIHRVRTDLFRQLLHLPLAYFYKHHLGVAKSRLITDTMMAQNFIGVAGINFVMEVTSIASISAMMLAMNQELAVLALSTMPLYVAVHKRFGANNRRKSLAIRRQMEDLEGGLMQRLQGIAETKAYARERHEEERFSDACEGVKQAHFDRIASNSTLLAASALLTRLPTVLVVWYGSRLVAWDALTVGQLLAFYAYLELMYHPLTRLSDLNVMLANSLAAIERVFEVLDERTEVCSSDSRPDLEVVVGRIEFKRVTFDYDERRVLNDFSLTIDPGETVALVGPSGAGKSTVVKLLLRLYEPRNGAVEIDRQPIDRVSLRSLRSQIAVVPQEVYLFDGSIEDNIRFGSPEASYTDVARAAENAGLGRLLESIPTGIQARVGERGGLLSGGQRQMIGVARAFLKNAPILVLDEFTANLDAESERQVCDAVDRLKVGRTTLIVSHRESTISGCDRIAVIDSGRVQNEGTLKNGRLLNMNEMNESSRCEHLTLF